MAMQAVDRFFLSPPLSLSRSFFLPSNPNFNPIDIITMQEVDHYYDFFLPELSAKGYTGKG
jgi:hypothetical protein